ncbi:hypothetical protein MERGE_001593 [Pneumocystis wakefieldiae]|uniref:SH3 domain-containing protein n=1 Tax=Pneumocystis wakefieldiae TaxID=38082 RepID=A0A899G368_9ASCO|nr:hypothetical protein MERGE_001593 [Pneumocystis wakefieldiae]
MKLNNKQCQALYDYSSEYPEDLRFNAGQIIDILGVEDADWYFGQYVDEAGCRSTGLFPKNYVQLSQETEEDRADMKGIVRTAENIGKTVKEEHAKPEKREKSDTLSSEESEGKKSVRKSFREILDSFNTPKEDHGPCTANRHSYIQKPKGCLSNTYINSTRQTEIHNSESSQRDALFNVQEQNTLQLGSVKDRILALKNIKIDNQESFEANVSNNSSRLEPIIEEKLEPIEKNTEKHNIAPKNISGEISSNSVNNSLRQNKNTPCYEPRNPKQGKNEDDSLTNDEKKISETISSKNNDSSVEDELARRAAIRERMAKMSYAGMNMHMVLGISKKDTTNTGPKSSPKMTSHNEDKSQMIASVPSVPIILSSPTKQSNRNHRLDNFSKSHIQNTNKEITTQNNSSETVKHSLSHLHLSTPPKCHDTVSVSENYNSLKDDNEDSEKSALYYTPAPIVEPFSIFLSKNSKNNSPILNNKIISPILAGQSLENFELSKLPQRPLKDPPSIPERPYSTNSPELFNNIDLSIQKQSTPCRPAKPLYTSKPSSTSKCTPPILSQYDNSLSHTCNISSELEFVSEQASKSRLSCSNSKDKSKYTYIFEEKQFCINEDKLEENRNSRNDVYKNDISSGTIYEKNTNDNISPISLTGPYVIQNIADDDDKVKKDIINNSIFTQTSERFPSNLQYGYSKYPGSPFQQDYSEECFSFSSPASDILGIEEKSNEYQSPPEKPYIHNQLSINELRGTRYFIDQRNINFDPFNQVEYIAHNIDLEKDTLWWTLPNALPSIFQNRKDILLKFFESSHLLKDGNTMVTKEIRILFHDYSETHILVTFNRKNPENANLKQIHRPSPIKPNQNQLEIAYEKFGTQIANLASLHSGIAVGDGSPFAFIQDIISNIPDALPSTGIRAYGALIYQNRANASTEQRDEIKAGDIISFRNAKFQGHKGSLYTKYSTSVGNPDHAAVIMEWDGTRRKIKVWEQGRGSKKVIQSSFKINDLKSGEICIWRVMSKSWVNWDS